MRKPRKVKSPPSSGGASVPKGEAKVSFGRTGYIDYGVDPSRPPKMRPASPKPVTRPKRRTK